MPAMQTQNGTLTSYAFRRGHVEKRTTGNGGTATLGHNASCYYVSYWHEWNMPYSKYFRTLTAARAYFRRVGNHSTPEGR